MLSLGAFSSILFSWWFLPLTVVTYTLLVFLASRDPFFQQQALEDRTTGENRPTPIPQPVKDISPERQARWLPKGETRNTVDSALEVYRKVVASIEESDDVAGRVLEDAVPKLHTAADRLVETATGREKAATVVAELKALPDTRKDQAASIKKLENQIRRADAEISGTYDQLLALRAYVAQVSASDTLETRATAFEVKASLDELNFRLEALGETLIAPGKDTFAPEDYPEKES